MKMISQGDYAVAILDENGLVKNITDGVYVSMEPGASYALQMWNNSNARCTVTAAIEGQEIGVYAVKGHEMRVIHGLSFPGHVHNIANTSLDGLLTVVFACERRPMAYHEQFYPRNASRSSGALFADHMFNLRLVSTTDGDVNIPKETSTPAWRGSAFH